MVNSNLYQFFHRFPRWGIRIKCAKIPDIPLNLLVHFCSFGVLIFKFSRVPVSKDGLSTYLFTPGSTIRPLFEAFNLSFPFEQPLNFSKVVDPDETLPSGLNTTGIYMGGETFPIINC